MYGFVVDVPFVSGLGFRVSAHTRAYLGLGGMCGLGSPRPMDWVWRRQGFVLKTSRFRALKGLLDVHLERERERERERASDAFCN